MSINFQLLLAAPTSIWVDNDTTTVKEVRITHLVNARISPDGRWPVVGVTVVDTVVVVRLDDRV